MNEDNTTCVICLEELRGKSPSSKTVQFDGCNHIMHSKCFFDHANYILKDSLQVLCPICRHVVINVRNNSAPSSFNMMNIIPSTTINNIHAISDTGIEEDEEDTNFAILNGRRHASDIPFGVFVLQVLALFVMFVVIIVFFFM